MRVGWAGLGFLFYGFFVCPAGPSKCIPGKRRKELFKRKAGEEIVDQMHPGPAWLVVLVGCRFSSSAGVIKVLLCAFFAGVSLSMMLVMNRTGGPLKRSSHQINRICDCAAEKAKMLV